MPASIHEQQRRALEVAPQRLHERGGVVSVDDAVVEGVHFTGDTAPEKIGHKALARCLSDIAAMAGRKSASPFCGMCEANAPSAPKARKASSG